MEGQDLGAVGDGEAGPGETRDAVEGEDHGDDGAAGGFVAGLGVDGGAAARNVRSAVFLCVWGGECLPRPDAEGDEHADGGGEEEGAAPEAVDEQHGEGDGDEEGPDLQAAVDDGLVAGVVDADAGEDIVDVVGDEAVAGALREEGGEDDEEEALAVAGRADEVGPAVVRVLLLEADGFLDLEELLLDEGGVWVVVGVVLHFGLTKPHLQGKNTLMHPSPSLFLQSVWKLTFTNT